MPPCPDCNPRPCWAAAPLVGGRFAWCACMITRRRVVVNTPTCNLENCTKHGGVLLCKLHKMHRIGTDQRPGRPAAARRQAARPAAGRQPGSRSPARQQNASPAAERQPGRRSPARQQIARQAAERQPGSRTPARQQNASPAADRQPGSRPQDRQQIARPAAMLYTRLRGREHPLRAALMFLRACADAQVLRTRPRAMRVRKRERWVGL